MTTEKALLTSSFFQALGMESAYFVGIAGYAAYDLQASPSLIATVMFFLTAFQMVGSAVAGPLIDHFGPRRTVLGTMPVNIVVSLLAVFIGKNVSLFVLFVSMMGLTFSIMKTSFNSFGPYIYDNKEGLARINQLIVGGAYVAAIVGPVGGALIVRNFPTMTVFIMAALVTMVAFAAIWRSEELRCPVYRVRDGKALKHALEGMRLNFTVPTLRFYLVVGILLWFSFGAFDALESLYYKDVVGVGVEWMGWVNSVIGFGLVVGVFILSKIPGKYLTAMLLTSILALEGIGSVAYTATSSIYFVMFGGFILGAAFGVAEPLMRTLIQHDCPHESIGRVMGASNIIRAGMTLIPLFFAPILAKQFGVQATLVGASLFTILAAVLLVPYSRSIDKREAATRKLERVNPLEDIEDNAPHDRIPLGVD